MAGPIEAIVRDASGLVWTARLVTGEVVPADATASDLVWFASADCTGTPLLPRWAPQVPFTVGPASPGAATWLADDAPSPASAASAVGPFHGCVQFSASGSAVAARQVGVVAAPRPAPLGIH
jgi:hypothetical protein